LSRYSGESDVVFGTTVSGRPATLAGAEEMVGLFINTLPVRVQIESDRTLIDWLKQFQTQQAEARQYEYTPLVQIQQWSELPPGTSLFESLVVVENFPFNPETEQGIANLTISRVRVLEQTNYPLSFVVHPGAELELTIVYDRDRFTEKAIVRMLQHLQTLLAGMVANPESRLLELPLLTPAEKQQLLAGGRRQKAEGSFYNPKFKIQNLKSKGECLHQLFETQVQQML
jgi:non-ribosomal peptide synthetase component F